MRIVDNLMVSLENESKSMEKLLHTKRWFSKAAGYKSNLQKSVGFIETRKNHWEDNIENTHIPFNSNHNYKTPNKKKYVKIYERGFPGGAVVESPPANAGDTGSIPGLGRSHMPRSNWAHEPQLLSLRVWSLCPATGGAAIVRGPRIAMKSGPHLPQLEKALARNEDPTQLKINK